MATLTDASPVVLPSFDSSIGFLLNKASQLVNAQLDAELVPYQLTGRSYGVLKYIEAHGSESQQLIGERLRIDRTTMVTIVDELEALDLVTRKRDTRDRRRYALTLSDHGRQTLRSGLSTVESKVTNDFMSSVENRDRETFAEVLVALVTNAGYRIP
ncbi:MarR family winged helix-turn-helix transcriptional regulator [Dietzia timorensis]|uniref:MarR family winged helix-turn-helix transcriptional regulator n=1 Tax=Dietzia timorensis TaxID=499555 RepID=UPI000830A17F|nr:helix-turn-helix domain-containing protein [Dietzia timorensis]